jgi:hypothetical protein
VTALKGGVSPDRKLKISQRMEPTEPPGTLDGTWVAAGAINDAGDATAQVSRPDSKGRGSGTHTLTGSAGTVTLDEDVRILPLPRPTPDRLMVEGTWKLVAATGAYADLNARGRTYATVDREKDPREITIVREGSAESEGARESFLSRLRRRLPLRISRRV